MSQDVSAARKFARRLIDCEGVDSAGPTATAGAQRAAERVWDELSKWTGVDGCHALLTRAVALAKAENPRSLGNATVGSRSRTWLEGISDNSSTNSADAGDNGVESILTALIELLTTRRNLTAVEGATLDARLARIDAEAALARLFGRIPFGGTP